MRKFNVILVLFLVAQSTNTYSMNAVRRTASRAATYVNRLAPRAKNLAESLLEKSPYRNVSSLSRAVKNTAQEATPKNYRNLKLKSKRLFSTETITPKPIVPTIGISAATILGTTAVRRFVKLEEWQKKSSKEWIEYFKDFTDEDLEKFFLHNPDISMNSIFNSDSFNNEEITLIEKLTKTLPDRQQQIFNAIEHKISSFDFFDVIKLTKNLPSFSKKLFVLAKKKLKSTKTIKVYHLIGRNASIESIKKHGLLTKNELFRKGLINDAPSNYLLPDQYNVIYFDPRKTIISAYADIAIEVEIDSTYVYNREFRTNNDQYSYKQSKVPLRDYLENLIKADEMIQNKEKDQYVLFEPLTTRPFYVNQNDPRIYNYRYLYIAEVIISKTIPPEELIFLKDENL